MTVRKIMLTSDNILKIGRKCFLLCYKCEKGFCYGDDVVHRVTKGARNYLYHPKCAKAANVF